MSIQLNTLSALQAAGSAIFTAEIELKKSVAELASCVESAILSDPSDPSCDVLFEAWKSVARLARAVGEIEFTFKEIYDSAAKLSSGARTLATIPVDHAVIKKAPAKRKSKTKRKLWLEQGGNTARVLLHMQKILSPNEFIKINRSAEAAVIGLPKGSIGVSIAKLLQTGQLIADPSGMLKLAAPKAAVKGVD